MNLYNFGYYSIYLVNFSKMYWLYTHFAYRGIKCTTVLIQIPNTLDSSEYQIFLGPNFKWQDIMLYVWPCHNVTCLTILILVKYSKAIQNQTITAQNSNKPDNFVIQNSNGIWIQDRLPNKQILTIQILDYSFIQMLTVFWFLSDYIHHFATQSQIKKKWKKNPQRVQMQENPKQ